MSRAVFQFSLPMWVFAIVVAIAPGCDCGGATLPSRTCTSSAMCPSGLCVDGHCAAEPSE